jgi:hypothetical protein
MLTFLASIVLIFIIASVILRILARTIWNPYGIRRPYFGPFGYYGYGRGYRHPRFGFLLPIVLLVALDRIFGRRW